MAFLHSHSTECMSSELDLFTLPTTQTSIESSSFLHYKPVSSLSDDVDAPLEFVVPAGSEHYFDLAHTMLHVQAKIKIVSPPNNAYPYRAYIETLLNYAPAAKESHLTASLWYDDTIGGFDSPANAVSTATAPIIVNKGLENFTQNRRYFDMIGHLHHDLFNQDKMLINGVEMRVRLVRSKDAFCLMDATADGKFKLSIKEAILMVRRVKISPGLSLAHAQALWKTTAKYPITRVEVKSFTLHSGILGDSIDNVIHGQLPKRIILGFVENKAFNGNRALNPFNFQHFSINYISLYVDGVQIPSKPLQPRFTGLGKLYIDAFQSLYTGTGVHFLNEGFGINRYNYYKGNFLTAFDLTPDLSAHCATLWNLVRSGSIRIEVRFETAVLTAINCIVYAEYDNVLEIDSSRQIVTDFSA
ncbi:uncharacterized protein F54H12.2-like [Nasonia vitripennis]|uniref:Uncharacterized protein n=1 Tax=Nasonia vitripennis TaxID=7425 RepID=A0A7M7Q4L7_NASVI|nr:uncharacterized protein F54H12.2-like [Nasonia vitripennis]